MKDEEIEKIKQQGRFSDTGVDNEWIKKEETDKQYGYDIGHWVCPRCGCVYSSKVSECSRCNPPMHYKVTY